MHDESDRLLEALGKGDARAASLFFRRHQKDVNRVVGRLLGADTEHDDLVQQSFVNILSSIHSLKDPGALRAWVISVTTRTVRHELRKRKVRRIVTLWAETPERSVSPVDHEARSLLVRCYAVLDQLPTDDRIAFALRFIDGQSLQEVGQSCGCSLATAKRRIRRGKALFEELARADPDLLQRISGSEGNSRENSHV